MPPYNVNEDFDELDFPDDASLGDLFEKATVDVFGDSFLLAIIETTTISNVSGIGTTQYIALKSSDYIRNTIRREYVDIIDEFKKDTDLGSPSKYFDWYKRSKFYFAKGSNDEATGSYKTVRNSIALPPEKKEIAEQYISDHDTKLTPVQLRKFFHQYVDSLLTKEWFRELPYYFVLVKPISVRDEKGSYIPLGNLYLKVGTKDEVSLSYYKTYVILLQAAWFRKYGAKILEEYYKKKTYDAYKPKLVKQHLINRFTDPFFNFNRITVTLDNVFYTAFDSGDYSHLHERYLISANYKLFDELVNCPKKVSDVQSVFQEWFSVATDTNILLSTLNGLRKLGEREGLRRTKTITYFLSLLSKRRLALVLLLLYDFSPEEAHRTLVFGKRKTLGKNHAHYLSTNLFIMGGSINYLIATLAEKEMEFLKSVETRIKDEQPSFDSRLSKYLRKT